jgi:hypothetical protein
MGAYYYDQLGPGGNLLLDLLPENPPIIVPSQGGSFGYDILIRNMATNYLIFDYWAEFLLPNMQVIGPYFLRSNTYLAAGDSLLKQASMHLSAGAMSGTYEYRGYAGEYPDTAWVSDYFTFVKESAGGDATSSGEIALLELYGWGDPEKIYLSDCSRGNIVANCYDLQLHNSPEPFNPETVFQFSLPSDGKVQLLIYDLGGRLVSTLLNRTMAAGSYEEAWDAANLPSGMYLARLVTPEGTRTERCLLVK